MTKRWMMICSTILVAAVVLSAGCGSSKSKDIKVLEETLRQYASTVRWGDIEQALSFVDPEVLKADPVEPFELERMRQLQVAGYRERPYAFVGELRVRQIVQIELVNRHTQEVRSTVDAQEWRFDPEAKRWWLMSGLPRFEPEKR
ncbi:MAG TPA: hypothetical protein VND91_02280 [Candidatus Saccharimonadia bacterium]|nr:hypothetical protein [Candidatus Saccharimonadia bacterium]